MPMTSMIHYSRHAQARQQQRGILGFVIGSLSRFGQPNYDHRGVGPPICPKDIEGMVETGEWFEQGGIYRVTSVIELKVAK
jgi:hypothetical protein